MKKILILLLIIIVIFAAYPELIFYEVNAYDNYDVTKNDNSFSGGVHRQMNQLAVEWFINQVKETNDPLLCCYDFNPSKSIRQVISVGVNNKEYHDHLFQAQGNAVIDTGKSWVNSAEKSLGFVDWVKEGGFSADEPEMKCGYHFYAPLARFRDRQYEEEISKLKASSWAIENSKNDYSFKNGQSALSSAFSENEYRKVSADYAKAWRSLGELMHLISDMTVPAHVRCDNHLFDFEPYEAMINEKMVAGAWERMLISSALFAGGKSGTTTSPNQNMAGVVGEAKSPGELFEIVASYTSANYFSADTFPGYEEDQRVEFSSPILDPVQLNGDQNYMGIDGSKERIVYGHQSWLTSNNWANKPPIITSEAVFSQARRLIPIAVFASAKMLDLYLPRIKVTMTRVDLSNSMLSGTITSYYQDQNGTYSVGMPRPGTSVQRLLLSVSVRKSGKTIAVFHYLVPATLVIDGQFFLPIAGITEDLTKRLSSYPDANTVIQIGLDMGGILVKSEEVAFISPPSVEDKPGEKTFNIDNLHEGDIFKHKDGGYYQLNYLESPYRYNPDSGKMEPDPAMGQKWRVHMRQVKLVIIEGVEGSSGNLKCRATGSEGEWRKALKNNQAGLLDYNNTSMTFDPAAEFYRYERIKPYISAFTESDFKNYLKWLKDNYTYFGNMFPYRR